MTVALLVAAFAALPLVVFRGRTLLRYAAWEVVSYAIAWMAWRVVGPDDARFFVITCAVLKLAAFSIALAFADRVRWSAIRAAVIAAIVYACVIPTQMRHLPDGDEPYYLLITESLVHDHDVDLANQYRDLAHSATGRTDLRPQIGDPPPRNGHRYSRYEPFLPLLLVPGYIAGRLPGSLAVVALFAVLLVRSTVRLLEDEGISERTIRACFPLFAFGPPVVFYAARIWPEVPGALCFVEAVRGVRQRRMQRWLPAVFLLSMLKLRFGLIAVVLVAAALWRRRAALLGVAAIVVPLAIVWMITGNALNVHSWRELMPFPARNYVTGGFGLIVDGAAGILFQAPFYLAGILALTRWKSAPAAFRLGCIAAVPYVLSLIPRSEWHGGWSPPLRYIVVFMPILFLGGTWLVDRWRAGSFVAPVAIWTAGLTIHGLTFPWRLFHIANGESPAGEWLSELHHSDFSRLFPSFIRPNHAAMVASAGFAAVVLLMLLIRRGGRAGQSVAASMTVAPLVAPLAAALVAWGSVTGLAPADRIEVEDTHVIHSGGELYPETYTVARFFFRGGWVLHAGDAVSFLARSGAWRLQYASATPVTVSIGPCGAGIGGCPDSKESPASQGAAGPAGQHVIVLPATGADYGMATLTIGQDGRTVLRCVSGVLNVDRMDHE